MTDLEYFYSCLTDKADAQWWPKIVAGAMEPGVEPVRFLRGLADYFRRGLEGAKQQGYWTDERIEASIRTSGIARHWPEASRETWLHALKLAMGADPYADVKELLRRELLDQAVAAATRGA